MTSDDRVKVEAEDFIKSCAALRDMYIAEGDRHRGGDPEQRARWYNMAKGVMDVRDRAYVEAARRIAAERAGKGGGE